MKLQNGSEVRGYISQIDESSFQVSDRESGHVTTIDYIAVDKVQGTGLSLGAKIAIASGVAVGVVVVIILGSLAASGG